MALSVLYPSSVSASMDRVPWLFHGPLVLRETLREATGQLLARGHHSADPPSMHVATIRALVLPLLIVTLDLCAQSQKEGTRPVEVLIGIAPPRFNSGEDSLAFAAFQERHMSNGASYSVPFRSRGYRLVWHMHQEDGRCTVTSGDGRTLKEFQDGPPAGYPTNGVKPTAYGTRCVVIVITQPGRPLLHDRWYFEAP